MKEKFRDIRLSKANKIRLDQINSIIQEYQAQGYRLTLRQLYYQLVSRDIIPNKAAEYGKLSTILKEWRMAWIVDWSAIEDRVRVPDRPYFADSPSDAINDIIRAYRLDRMAGQDTYLEVWVEKDALSGVLKRVTEKYGINIMVNRGYSSVSAMYDAFRRFKTAHDNNQKVRVIYLGDYDPSGIDMIRDINDRITEFFSYRRSDEEMDGHWWENYYDMDFEIVPIALTREQIDLYNPPPNPAKTTDPRSGKFISENGHQSWEVDALKPQVLNTLLDTAITEFIDVDKYEAVIEQEKQDIIKFREAESLFTNN
jgi:hypothetical protein